MKYSVQNNVGTIILGIGNSGRSDDGLGWEFLKRVENSMHFKGLPFYRYQLQVEDAELIKDFKTVIFVDSVRTPLKDGYNWKECKPEENHEFTTHTLSPETVVSLCNGLYKRNPIAFVLEIQGYDWELELGLSEKAIKNLEAALNSFFQLIDTDSELIIN